MRSNFNSASSINPEMAPNQPSWLAKHQNAAGNPEALQMLEAERSDLAGITKQYLDLSTVHGLRYVPIILDKSNVINHTNEKEKSYM